ncbi:30S ribosomal protein S7 [candidate division WWE3 bacterium RIFCSPLOWO2_01_FULL_42_11]|uniref:Small ribosomal subunit protein uS7 n=1 Tax=candidate division WWE3 bacterium RIFCSPLOWO2_01_FULL_42_11 TaxID=1802627 RepID=A0A1F4VRH7_UNCKA|nr:MAG: 30S ribosomal protein S7 [candidate division WWE3 bacterium RIFCSPLOWO2_01_FULL_42_11]
MPRHAITKKRTLYPDPLYKSRLVTRMVNAVMLDGKKGVAQGLVYGAIGQIDADPVQAVKFFDEAMRNVMPSVEVRSRRVGGANYQVPVPVRNERSEALAVRWVIDAARARKGKPMTESLSMELQDALKKTGEAVKKRDTVYKMAEANKAFSHFRW